MKEENDFYIGWKEELSESNSSFLKKVLIPLFILIPVLVFAIVYFQKPFNDHKFELGKITTLTGTYYNDPIPMLIADKGVLPDSLSHDVVLVGYGKFGAEGIINNIEKDKGAINGKKVTLKGTLIYGSGKTIMELTKKEASLVEVLNAPSSKIPNISKKMKPGEGKIHKSCAIRCISGGIPPVLKTKKADNSNQYYILLDEAGNPINDQVLTYIAEPVSVSGKTNTFSNWDVLYINTDNLKLK